MKTLKEILKKKHSEKDTQGIIEYTDSGIWGCIGYGPVEDKKRSCYKNLGIMPIIKINRAKYVYVITFSENGRKKEKNLIPLKDPKPTNKPVYEIRSDGSNIEAYLLEDGKAYTHEGRTDFLDSLEEVYFEEINNKKNGRYSDFNY
jgi:hypothetical protein